VGVVANALYPAHLDMLERRSLEASELIVPSATVTATGTPPSADRSSNTPAAIGLAATSPKTGAPAVISTNGATCGVATQAGHPCTRRVDKPGDRCGNHKARETLVGAASRGKRRGTQSA
jgi:hypothetical protein